MRVDWIMINIAMVTIMKDGILTVLRGHTIPGIPSGNLVKYGRV